VSDSIASIVFTSDHINLVVCGVKSSKLTPSDKTAATDEDDDVLFIIRQRNTGSIVSRVKPNHPEYRLVGDTWVTRCLLLYAANICDFVVSVI